jgi:hypothetical protein
MKSQYSTSNTNSYLYLGFMRKIITLLHSPPNICSDPSCPIPDSISSGHFCFLAPFAVIFAIVMVGSTFSSSSTSGLTYSLTFVVALIVDNFCIIHSTTLLSKRFISLFQVCPQCRLQISDFWVFLRQNLVLIIQLYIISMCKL